MDFNQACELIRDIVANHKYKVIHRYRYDIPWSFKFEKRAVQYDPIDLLYMHHLDKPKPIAIHTMISQLNLRMSDAVCLFQLSNGNWTKYPFLGGPDDRRKELFEQITGISVR